MHPPIPEFSHWFGLSRPTRNLQSQKATFDQKQPYVHIYVHKFSRKTNVTGEYNEKFHLEYIVPNRAERLKSRGLTLLDRDPFVLVDGPAFGGLHDDFRVSNIDDRDRD